MASIPENPSMQSNEVEGANQAPVPASGIRIDCPTCGAAATTDQRFCGSCGANLWEPCIDCGTVNPADKKFCGSCGAPLKERLEQFLKEFNEAEQKARDQAKEGYFLQAIKLLESFEFVEHSQLKKPAETVKRLCKQFETQREQVTQEADRVLEETRELEQSGHLREALRAAEQIPKALRGRELANLHHGLEERLKLSDRLQDQLDSAMEKKQYEGLLPTAEKLTELNPWDKKLRRLVEKLTEYEEKCRKKNAKKYLSEAKTHLKECEYRKADKSLSLVPLDVLDEKSMEAYRRRKEKVWLATQSARAPYLSLATESVVNRLVELQPHDKRAQQLLTAIKQRREQSLKNEPGRPIPWSVSKEVKESQRDFQHAGCPAFLSTEIGKRKYSAGQFLTSFGLALQGVERASYNINLAPKKGLLGRIASAASGKKSATAWGIDLGSHSLKAVKISRDQSGEMHLDDLVLISHTSPEVTDQQEGGSRLSSEMIATLRKFMESHTLSGEHLVVGMPGAQTLGRFFVLPFLSKKKFSEAVRLELRARIPRDPEEVIAEHLEWDVPEEENDGVHQKRVAMVAATIEHIKARTDPFGGAKGASLTVTSNALALANAVQFDREALGIEEGETFAVVSLGANSTDIVVPSENDLWFRGLYVGSSLFDQALMKELKLDQKDAEKIRRKLDKAKWMHQVDVVLEPVFREVGDAIRRSLDQYTQETERTVRRVLICGGAADQFGLIRTLRAQASELV